MCKLYQCSLPVAPAAPVQPRGPRGPGGPSSDPVAPVLPAMPVDPVMPVQPVYPVAPVAPGDPVDPVAPGSPFGPRLNATRLNRRSQFIFKSHSRILQCQKLNYGNKSESKQNNTTSVTMMNTKSTDHE